MDNIIRINNLSKYYNKVKGIENLSLRVKRGEIFGFIGPNGAGKSTTIRTLLGLLYPTGGSAEIMGMDIIKDAKEIKKRVGFMPSEVNYYNKMSVRELFEYSAGFYDVEADDRIKELAETFQLNLDKKLLDLSQGNKKKVSIIQSLIHNPELLILDEPTSGLDPLIQTKFFELLRQENKKGVTVFFSSHILSEVEKLCKRVAIIKEGSIIKVEDIETLRSKQLKKVKISFGDNTGKEELRINGVINMEYKNNNTYSFLFSGVINDLFNILINKNIINITIEEPSLEEIFLHYYSN